MEKSKVSFSHFLEKFPEVPLPVTLDSDSHHTFGRENAPLPDQMVAQFLLPLEREERDAFSEYIACFRIPDTHGFHAIVYWKAALMNYQYKLVTFTKNGEFIDQRVIAGTFSDGNTLTTSIARIEEDWEILVISGQAGAKKDEKYDASTSTAYSLELLPDGTIVNLS